MTTAPTKVVYIHIGGIQPAISWAATTAQIADLQSRWDAVRNGGAPDALVITQPTSVLHIDLRRVVALAISA